MQTTQRPSGRTRRTAAIAAGALCRCPVGLGANTHSRLWNDSEWVWGGADGDPNVGTSKFNVQQNTSVPYVGTSWGDFDVNPGDELTFTAGALTLSPSDTIYAPVALWIGQQRIGGR